MTLHDRLTEAIRYADDPDRPDSAERTPWLINPDTGYEKLASAILAAPSMQGVEAEVESLTADLISENQKSAEAILDADALAEVLRVSHRAVHADHDPHLMTPLPRCEHPHCADARAALAAHRALKEEP